MALSSFLILIFLDNSKEKQEYSSYPFFAQCNGIIHPFSFPSSTHLHHLLLSLAVLRALITEERKRCLHRQAISKCQCRTSITSVDAMKKEAASMLACSRCVAASAASRLASIAWRCSAVAASKVNNTREHHVYHSAGAPDVL
ncbi:hypothetical protein EUGRSUZ_C04141 [Eucalyptus grandis]|uniref:Uncharacterized protein n=2 Tax=Eucalyptus grandis TaxID=71139 RepID=A0ACC3LLW0_EUCGR|nr:hypothetical protein EUGRSUZ_C04141 [Eucalyptus grandis]